MNLKVNNNQFINFKGIQKKSMSNNNEEISGYTERAVKKMKERAEREVPEYGNFKSVVHLFDIPNTLNEAVFTIKYNITPEKNRRILTVGARRNGFDRENCYIAKEGTKKEILEFLDEAKTDEIVKNLSKCSNLVDKYYS